MIEIALCLAIIGFALVAIIGVLPTGLDAQRKNREETIINQDASVWMDAIRSGARGYDDLTNYVLAITNTVTLFQGTNMAPPPNPVIYMFTYFTSTKVDINGVAVSPPLSPPFLLNSGSNIIGLLSKPKIEWTSSSSFVSNYVTVSTRAISGAAVEKFPETNQQVLDAAFTYRMIVENIPYVPFDPESTNFLQFAAGSPNWLLYSNYARIARAQQTNSHDLRLTFRWPYLPNGDLGNGRQTFRVLTGGELPLVNPSGEFGTNLYFFKATTLSTLTLTNL